MVGAIDDALVALNPQVEAPKITTLLNSFLLALSILGLAFLQFPPICKAQFIAVLELFCPAHAELANHYTRKAEIGYVGQISS